ncbi:MAG: acyltransferase [Sphingomonadales bacterium]|nr:acyltransferase [Sphingomonadales bacterium]
MRQDRTFHSIQLLRAVAATLVVLFHAHEAFASRQGSSLLDFQSYLFGFGAVGVHIFFVISGFIMVLTGASPGRPYSAPRFFRRRFLRIYPMYWLCAFFYVGVHALIGRPYDVPPDAFVRGLLLWPVDSGRLIGPAWTLSFEMYFYICFGFAMLLGMTRGLIALTLGFLAALAIGQLFPNRGPVIGLPTNLLLLEFLAGTGIGWLAQTRRLPLRWGPALTGLGIALFVAGIALGYRRVPSAVSWGIPSALLVFGLVIWETRAGASPAVRRLGKLGDSSYVLYLIHVLAITLAAVACEALGLNPPPLLAAIALAPLAIVLAEIVHRVVEVPLLALLRRGGSLLVPGRPAAPRPSELP